ncbi:hypothetical protein OPW39_15865 [Vibrio europaeus]|uniref:hypothetical protein n=1 Tax=Vibrio europaeus TaxID=300876 RepID=UPI00233F166E|nr:hypothetical protein [Vibrio europaeus]MDC5870285.1 hypothetical protein [Vibrio europaeus]
MDKFLETTGIGPDKVNLFLDWFTVVVMIIFVVIVAIGSWHRTTKDKDAKSIDVLIDVLIAILICGLVLYFFQ